MDEPEQEKRAYMLVVNIVFEIFVVILVVNVSIVQLYSYFVFT